MQLEKNIAATILKKIRDLYKTTHEYLISLKGKFSQKETNEEERSKGKYIYYANDLVESIFRDLNQKLNNYRRIALLMDRSID